MRKLAVAAVAGAMLAGAAAAQQIDLPPGSRVYDCNLPMANGFIPRRIFLLEYPDRSVKVWDGYVKAATGHPIPAAASEDGAALRVNWTTAGIPGHTNRGTSDSIDVRFHAVVDEASGAITMASNVLAMDNPPYQGTGRCQVK